MSLIDKVASKKRSRNVPPVGNVDKADGVSVPSGADVKNSTSGETGDKSKEPVAEGGKDANKDGEALEGLNAEEEEEEEEDILPPDVMPLPTQYRSFKPNLTPEEGEKMSLLLESFSEEQMSRYESYRRAGFPRAAMKRVMQQITGSIVPPTAVIVMSGITKIFCGEVVESSIKVQTEWKDSGALRPKHIREGLRRLRNNGETTVTGLKPFKKRRLD